MQAREHDLECRATDVSHVAFEKRQVVGDVKVIPQLANRRARTGANEREVLVARGPGVDIYPTGRQSRPVWRHCRLDTKRPSKGPMGHTLFTEVYKVLRLDRDYTKQEQGLYQTGRGRKIYHTQTPRSIGATGLRAGCRKTATACQIGRIHKMCRGNPGRFDKVEGLRAGT